MQDTSHWFEQGLGARIDALEVALRGVKEGDAEDVADVRNLARSLVGPAALHGFDAIRQAAANVDQAEDSVLAESVQALIDMLRQEAAKTKQAVNTILLVGGDEAFCAQLVDDISAPSREILAAETAAEAEAILRQREVMFIILNLFLPDIDGRAFLLKLREDPMTTSIPVLIVAPTLTPEVREEAQILDADILVESPPNTAVICDRVNARLRRARESAKAARRDPLTGLLNRAAFREAFTQVLSDIGSTEEPLALAVLAVDAPRNVLDRRGVDVKNQVLRHVGQVLSNSLRSTDVIGRWGPCEFAVLFPGEDQAGGAQAAAKVLDIVRKATFNAEGGDAFPVTLSAGVTVVASGTSIDDAVSDADRFLFQAAAAGGDRVISSESGDIERTERVLLLIHDKITAQVLEHLFEKDGFHVTRIGSVDGPLAPHLGPQKFHLIVIDEGIPERGGFDVLQELRALPRNSRTPMVMLIGRGADSSMVRALELGANDYVMRPFSPLTFIRRMRRLLKRNVAESPDRGGEICRVLIIDADPKALLLAASALHERGGFRPYLAQSIASARERLAHEHPDVVVLDIDMDEPGVGDYARKLAAESDPSRTALLLASAARGRKDLEDFMSGACRGVIGKPFDALSLGQQIEGTLNMSPSSRQADDAAEHLNREIKRITGGAG